MSNPDTIREYTIQTTFYRNGRIVKSTKENFEWTYGSPFGKVTTIK